jgi:hypothetical protein
VYLPAVTSYDQPLYYYDHHHHYYYYYYYSNPMTKISIINQRIKNTSIAVAADRDELIIK